MSDLLFSQDEYTYGDELINSDAAQGADLETLAAGVEGARYADPSDAYANARQIVISFYSLIAGDNFGSVNFKAFVTNISDAFTCDWNEEMVFGRNDPIYNFKHTKRSISLSFQLVAASRYEAVANMDRLQTLIKMLYPAYKSPYDLVSSLTKSPLIKLKFGNLISDHSTPGASGFNTVKGGTASAKNGGLVGVIKSLNVTPNFDSGVYDGPGAATMYPKLIEIALEFGVIHQATLGFNSDSNTWLNSQGNNNFPYGANVTEMQNSIDDSAMDIYFGQMAEELQEAGAEMDRQMAGLQTALDNVFGADESTEAAAAEIEAEQLSETELMAGHGAASIMTALGAAF
tara:strand:+ start:996 stop:2030 length:1035 start_codon:yes stop_codon:yes gene_type:complete